MNIQIPYHPYPYQKTLHKDQARFKIITGGRRVGKTICCLHEAIKHCIENPNAMVFWVAPTYNEAKEIGFDEFTRLIPILQPAIHSIHHTSLRVRFVNGSTIYFKGSDNANSLRGRGLTLVVCDEAAFFKPDVWSKILRPALSDKKGKAILISTPNGFNWFKDIYEKSKRWSKYLWPTQMNPLITEEELISVREQISLDEYKQEYLAEFITKAGRVYDEFTGENIIPIQPISTEKYDIFLGMDFGYAHHTAIVFIAVDRATGNKVIQFDEIYVKKEQMDIIIARIRHVLGSHGLTQADIAMCFTDPAGNAEELSSGLSPVDMLRDSGFKVVNKGSSVNAGIALVRSYIRNSLGVCRFFITPNCTETLRSMYGYQYNSSKSGIKEEPLKDNLHDHLMDAMRYFFVNKFDHAKYVASTPYQSAYSTGRRSKVMKMCTRCHRPFLSNTPKNEPPNVCSNCSKG